MMVETHNLLNVLGIDTPAWFCHTDFWNNIVSVKGLVF